MPRGYLFEAALDDTLARTAFAATYIPVTPPVA
jgi:hypothetical protein